MMGVNRGDQILSYYPCEHKSIRLLMKRKCLVGRSVNSVNIVFGYILPIHRASLVFVTYIDCTVADPVGAA